jgi:ribosomal protein S18 acetylase RimI-like enzyme
VPDDQIRIRKAQPGDLSWMEAVARRLFAAPRVASRGRLHYVRDLPGLIAELDGARAGLLLYHEGEHEVEIVVLVSEIKHRGIARGLVETLRRQAMSAGFRRLWLVTTNNNLEAIAFYRATGWQQVAVHRGAVKRSRLLKPEIPEIGPSRLPIEDEIEFAIDL